MSVSFHGPAEGTANASAFHSPARLGKQAFPALQGAKGHAPLYSLHVLFTFSSLNSLYILFMFSPLYSLHVLSTATSGMTRLRLVSDGVAVHGGAPHAARVGECG